MKAEFIDFTGRGLLDGAYSYNRPAYIVANAIMNGLIDAGFTHKQAYNWIYSKSYRHFLYGKEHRLEQLAYELGKAEGERSDPNKYDYELDYHAQSELARISQLYANWEDK